MTRTHARVCESADGGTLRRDASTETRSITHAARQAGTRYRKAEIDNAGGPPAPYPNLDTRPAVAPGPPLVRTARCRGCLRSRRFLFVSFSIYQRSFTSSCREIEDSLNFYVLHLTVLNMIRFVLLGYDSWNYHALGPGVY